MARIRSVHPGLFKDEAFMELSMGARVLLIGVWTIADDHGVFEWKPKAIRAEVFPGDNVDIDALLSELVTHQFVVRFEDCDRAYAVVRNFCLYQRPREPSYRFPFPQDIHSHAGVERRKAEDLVKANGRTTAAPTQDSSRPTEKPSHRRGGKRERREGEKPQATTAKTERESPGNVETMPSASPPGSLSEISNRAKEGLKEGMRPLASFMGSQLSETWTPDDELCTKVTADFGMEHADIQAELQAFHAHHAANGSFSANWRASFVTWCKRWREHKDKQAPPRVEVSNTAPKRPQEFTEADWDREAGFYARTGRWSRGAGPDPMSRGCLCPREILTKHGIDENGERRIPPRKPHGEAA